MDISQKLKELKDFYENGFITKETWELEQKKLMELWRGSTGNDSGQNKTDKPDQSKNQVDKENEIVEDKNLTMSSVFLEFASDSVTFESSNTLLESKIPFSHVDHSSLEIACGDVFRGNCYMNGKLVATEYQIIKEIGRGGMGEVYLASNNGGTQQFAIKFLHLGDESNMIDRFFRELQLLMSLDHPNIVSYRGQGNHNNRAFIVMEYISGKNLEQLISEKTLNTQKIIYIIKQLLEVLIYAKKVKLIHRDIKPGNILVTNGGRIKLIDLGLSKVLEQTLKITRTGEMMGSAFYMAPEQVSSPGSESYACDTYALGATLYHMLCGIPPFSEYKNITQILLAKVKDNYIRLAARNPNIPSNLLMLVENTMKLKQEERWSLELIKQFLESV